MTAHMYMIVADGVGLSMGTSRAVMHGWTNGSFPGLHCVMLIKYFYIAFIGVIEGNVPGGMFFMCFFSA